MAGDTTAEISSLLKASQVSLTECAYETSATQASLGWSEHPKR